MNMKLVTGYSGTEHVTAEMDADLNRGIIGEDGILTVGEKMKATVSGTNVVINDGICVIDGRGVYIPYGSTHSLAVQTESGSTERTDLVVIEYKKDSNGIESVLPKVIKGTSGSTADPKYTNADIRTGANLSQKPLCRVKVKGSSITVEMIMKERKTLAVLEEYFETLKEGMEKCLIID